MTKQIGVCTDRYKLIYFYEINEWELFDLKKDPDEIKSVYDAPNYAQVRKDLKNKLRALQVQYKDPEPAIPEDF